ncbi:hypothetical protein PRIC1_008722 [Phytophthora ramorum]|nr:hypothetical protein KRP22_5894 [Phytophthora ramorum]
MLRLVLLAASCVLATQAMTTREMNEDVTFDSVELAQGRKLAGATVDTTLWAEGYTPGEVTTATDEERAAGVWPTSKGTVPLTKPKIVGPTTPGTISKASITTSTNYPVCTRFNGGATPKKVGNGASPPVCSYSAAAVKVKSPVTQS